MAATAEEVLSWPETWDGFRKTTRGVRSRLRKNLEVYAESGNELSQSLCAGLSCGQCPLRYVYDRFGGCGVAGRKMRYKVFKSLFAGCVPQPKLFEDD